MLDDDQPVEGSTKGAWIFDAGWPYALRFSA